MPKTQVRRRKAPSQGPVEKKPTVLAVEDSATQAEALRATLREGGFDVTLARSGDDALRSLSERAFDLVLSDIVMPGEVDGYELCRRIKAGPHRETPVVLLTSLSDPMDIIHGLEAGADNFVTKPYEPEHLLERLAVLLTSRKARGRSRVRAGVTVYFMGREFTITSEREQILDLLVSTFEDAVRQNRELRQREAALARSQQMLGGLYGVAVALNGCATEAEVADTALDMAMRLPGVRAGWVSLREGDTGFRLAAARNLPPALRAAGAMEGDCLCQRRLLSGELGQVTNILECERLQQASGQTRGLRYHASVPLWIGDRTVGVLNLVGAERGLFSDEDRATLYGVGNQVAMAMERARLREHLERLVEQRTAALRAEVAERERAETTARESERLYRSLFENMLNGFAYCRMLFEQGRPQDFVYLAVNDAFETQTGLRGVAGKKVSEVIPGIRESDPGMFEIYGRVVSTGVPEKFEMYVEALKMWFAIAVYRPHEGHFVAVFDVVTERKRAEEALRASEERYRMLVNEVNDGFFVTDDRGVILLANRALATIHGFSDPSQLMGHPFTDFIPPHSVAQLDARFRAGIESGVQPATITAPIARPDGTERVVEINPVNVVERGCVTGTRGVVRDVTDRVRAEEALRLSDSILQCIGNLVLVAGPDGGIVYASPSVNPILGYEPEEILGDGWWDLAWDDPGRRDLERAAAGAAARGEIAARQSSYEQHARTRDGKRRWILWHDAKGPGVLLIGVGVDVTEAKSLEEQLRQSQKMEAVGRLAGGIAHDFNNLLTAITGYTDLLREDTPRGDPRRQDLDEIGKAAQRAAALTRQLLAFSRQQVLQPKVLDLNEVVGGMDKMLRRIIGEDVDLATVLEPALGRVRADPGQIEQVIANLAVNSRDAMPGGGRLTIETANVELAGEYEAEYRSLRPGSYVMLAVSDTGSGIAEEIRPHLFEPFFTTKEPGKGTGLGLATVYGIVQQSGGQILVYSEPGHGTTFKVYLPRVADAAEPLTPGGRSQPPSHGSETILLVEDEAGVRDLARRVLERRGYQVLVAANGDEACRLCRDHTATIHLLLTDLVMPGMTGAQLSQELRQACPQMKVLFMSGYPDRAVAHQSVLEAGVPFLQKPFAADALAQKVREVLDG